ncbi:MAG: hypothetical protein EBY22_06690 [Gammaproteobacteria bacterium]|nr:hypothetical protein [Gammaproteobacteria bacterium]
MHSSTSAQVPTLATTPDRRAYPTYDRWAIVIEVSAWVLAISASMILGLLSFSGMLAIWPVLPLAFAAFLFAIVIEGQIYLDNMRSSLEKLSDPKAYEHQLSDLYLQEKLVNYDKNRDLFILNEPTEDNKRRVREHNEVVVFKKNGQYAIGFRNNKGEYEQKDFVDAEQNKFLAHYSQKEEFMEIPGHHDLIQTILRSFDGQLPDRPQEQYPVLVHAYVSQCRYLRKLNCYLHTQVANEASQNELKNMNMHLTKLSEDMSEYLFHNVSRDNVAASLTFKISLTGKTYSLNLEAMTVKADEKPNNEKGKKFVLPGFEAFNQKFTPPAMLDLKTVAADDPLLVTLSDATYAYHRNKLIEWIVPPDKAAWKKRLTQHTINSRIAFVIAAFSGLIMGIGTTYLIMEAVAVIPWLMLLPLSLFPPVIGPLAVIAGAAYGLLIYNSLTDILLDNPAKKFIDRMRAISSQEMTIKRVLILSLSLVLFLVTIFLTMCTAGTWLTVFHKTKPLVAWLSVIPNVLLNIIIPILIGISVLPFSFQSVSNTLEGLEANPSLDRAINALNPRRSALRR